MSASEFDPVNSKSDPRLDSSVPENKTARKVSSVSTLVVSESTSLNPNFFGRWFSSL